MNKFESYSRSLTWFMALLLSALVAGCGGGGGGGRDPILGTPGLGALVPPTVTAVSPLANATGVPTNIKTIAATFSKPMDIATLTPDSFTLACGAAGTAGIAGTPKTLVAGGVTNLAAGNMATLTLPAANLPTSADCTATVTSAAKDTTGIPLASNFVWTFTTGATADNTAPTVTSTAPPANATGVVLNTLVVASFSEPMNPLTITGVNFTLACPAGTAITGTVGYAVSGNVATFTPASNLPASTICTATITTGVKDVAGNAMASAFTWTFTTGATADTTRPRVTLTAPATTIPGPTAGVPTNTTITAVFTEDMAPTTLVDPATSFTLTGPGATPVAGAVTYAVGSKTVTFTPAAVLLASTTYTARIKGTGASPATDLAGNALAGDPAFPATANDYVWTFTTGAGPIPPGNISVSATNTVCPNAVNATFSTPGLPMNAGSVAANFSVTDAGLAVVPGTVALDTSGFLATFTPTVALTNGASYTLTITGGAAGVKDTAIAPNTLNVNPYTLAFTAGPATGVCIAPAHLVAAATFANYGGSAGMTSSGINTIMNGDIGTIAASSLVTGFHDLSVAYSPPPAPLGTRGCSYGETPLNLGVVNGLIYTDAGTTQPTGSCPNEGTAATMAVAQAAALDAWNEFNALAALPGGTVLGVSGAAGPLELGTRTLAPGVYSSGSTYDITIGDLTLDAGGNANAVWVFQMGSSLTVGIPGSPRSVILTNGAQAKNVYWVAGTGTNGPGRVIDGGAGSATINGTSGGTMVGTIIATAAVSFSTAGLGTITTLNGRAMSVKGPLIGGIPSAGAGVTMNNTVINVPAP